jgi:hypothetical protein
VTIAHETVRLTDWLATRVPAPPDALAQRLAEIVGDDSCRPDELPARLIQHTEDILRRIGDDRSHATDLLAADALITYAMEAVADACRDPGTIASDAMQRIARTAGE